MAEVAQRVRDRSRVAWRPTALPDRGLDWECEVPGYEGASLKMHHQGIVPQSLYQVVTGTGWENTEFRSYRFVEGDDDNASLEETDESRSRRNEQTKPPTKEEKTQLRETATNKWEQQGYEKASKV